MNFTLKKSDLNFKVYTVEAKPTAPGAENDIAVISPVPMTNWLMSPEKPSGIPRNDGDVWIRYSVTGNTKNILKQNAMMIATISAWQYVDGEWVFREAVSCQGGAWVDWVNPFYLFDNGAQVEFVGYATSPGNYYIETDKIRLHTDAGNGSAKPSQVNTKNALDVTLYRKLCVEYSVTVPTDGALSFTVGLATSNGNSATFTDAQASISVGEGESSSGTLSVNLDTVEGSFYVKLRATMTSRYQNTDVIVTKVYLS